MKCYSFSSAGRNKRPSISITDNYQKICSKLRRTETKREIRKRATFIKLFSNSFIYKYFNQFSNHKKKTKKVTIFSRRPLHNVLNTWTTVEAFHHSGKQDSLRQILKNLVSMYASSGSQFFRTIDGIQSGPNTLGESKLVVTEILRSFRLFLEGTSGKEM